MHNRKFLLAIGLLTIIFGLTAFFPVNNQIEKNDNTFVDQALIISDPNFDVKASIASQFGPAVNPGRVLQTADMITTNPLIPSDIYRPSGTKGPTHEDLATFAWLEFISLVSPAASGARGETGGSFAQSGSTSTFGNLVWETYQHRAELFPYIQGNDSTGRAPDPWDQTPNYKMFYTDVNGNKQKLDIPYQNYNNLDETTQIGMNILYFPMNPSLMDPDHDFEVLFEAKVNQGEWNYVNNNYQNFSESKFNGINFDPGTIEVKATWRPLSSIPTTEQYRYHTSNAIWYNGEDTNPEAKVGSYALIGLHIIHKTPNFPTFIFATFEHTDNLTSPSTGATGLYYVPSYDSIEYSLPPTTATVFPTKTVTNENYPSGWTDAPYAAPNGGAHIPLPKGSVTNIAGAKVLSTSEGNVVGIPVTQPAVTNSAVKAVNTIALNAMGNISGFNKDFVWQYYFLKGVQGVPSNDESDPDYYLANIVTESSVPGIQLFAGGQKIVRPEKEDIGTLSIPRNQANVRDVAQGGNILNQGGCQGCHGIAQTGSGFDFSFLYFRKTKGFDPEVHGLASQEILLARSSKYEAMFNPVPIKGTKKKLKKMIKRK